MNDDINQAITELRNTGFSELADAGEQLQENLHEAKIENTINITKALAYERILDKGITVNVYCTKRSHVDQLQTKPPVIKNGNTFADGTPEEPEADA